MKLTDITGKHPEVPVCPDHANCALIHEYRPRAGGKTAMGFWRCPIDNHVYAEEVPLTLKA